MKRVLALVLVMMLAFQSAGSRFVRAEEAVDASLMSVVAEETLDEIPAVETAAEFDTYLTIEEPVPEEPPMEADQAETEAGPAETVLEDASADPITDGMPEQLPVPEEGSAADDVTGDVTGNAEDAAAPVVEETEITTDNTDENDDSALDVTEKEPGVTAEVTDGTAEMPAEAPEAPAEGRSADESAEDGTEPLSAGEPEAAEVDPEDAPYEDPEAQPSGAEEGTEQYPEELEKTKEETEASGSAEDPASTEGFESQESTEESTEETAEETDVTEDTEGTQPQPEEAAGDPEGTDEALLDIGEDEIIAEFEAELEAILPDLNADNAEELLNAYVEKLLAAAVRHPGLLRAIRVDGRLDEVGYALYQSLKPSIEAIAAGNQSSTVLSVGYADLGLPTSFTATELGLDIQTRDDIYAGVDLVAEQLKINYALVQLALLANCPYELYWYDKSTGARTTVTPGMRVRRVNGEYVYEITSDYTVRMTVAQDYSAADYEVDTSVGQKVQHSVTTAQHIVEKYRGLNDLEKLEAYRDEICRLVSYNGSAAGGGQPYGDPWQIVYVFDEDSGTNVVCEGYAKAFQYLCDMTEFDGSVNCYTVTGRMDWGTGAGTHMWNIVTMSDGQNYLVDLTNSDSGTLGADGSLFLTGDAEDDDGALIFRNEKGQPIRYRYNDDTTSLYTDEELTLAGRKFEVTCHLDLYPYHTLAEVPAIPATCEEAGRAAYWVCEQDGGAFADGRGAAAVSEDDLVIPALGHAYGEWTVTTPPTCEEDGEEQRVCAHDETHIETRPVAKLGHAYGEWPLTTPPTCEEDGEEQRVCAHDETHIETRPVAKLGHQLIYVPGRVPTYTAEGWIEYWICEACGELFADGEASVPLTLDETRIPKLEKPTLPARMLSDAAVNAMSGWRIEHIDELLTAEEAGAFAPLPLYDQLTVLAAVLSGVSRAAGNGAAAELAAGIMAAPDRTAAFRAAYPVTRHYLSVSLPSPAYEVRLVSTADPAQTKLILLGVQQNGRMRVAETI